MNWINWFFFIFEILEKTYEEIEEEIVKYYNKKENACYHLAQVEPTYFIIIAYDKDHDKAEISQCK